MDSFFKIFQFDFQNLLFQIIHKDLCSIEVNFMKPSVLPIKEILH